MNITIHIDRVNIIANDSNAAVLDRILQKVTLLGTDMSKFVEEFKTELADVKQKVAALDTVNESIKTLVAAQTAKIDELVQRALDAPSAEEKDAILVGIREIGVAVNGEVDELQVLVQQGTAAEGVA